jgi:DNA polymerase III sliding clamp (beta) subunit (PCNA family)
MTDLYELAQTQQESDGVSFEILPAEARLSVAGNRLALVHLFDRAVSVVPTKAVVAGTEWVQLDVEQGEGTLPVTRLSATDGEMALSVESDALESRREGSALLPGKKVLDILKLAPGSEVDLTVLGNTATITAGRARWTVTTPPGSALPPRPDVSDVELFTLNRQDFVRGLSIARLAVSNNDSRMALQQALIRKQMITGSDAGRVHRVKMPQLPAGLDTTLPARYLDELIRALRDSKDEEVHFGAGALHNVANVGRDTLISQRYMLGYPDIEAILLTPTFENQESFQVVPLQLIDVVKRVRVNADPDQQSIFLDLTPGSTKDLWNLVVWARDRTGNTAREVLPTVWSGGKKPRSFCVSSRHLIELLAATREQLLDIKVGPDLKSKRYPLLVEAEAFTGVLQQQMVL